MFVFKNRIIIKRYMKKFIILSLVLMGLVGCTENFDPSNAKEQKVTSIIEVNPYALVQRQMDFMEETQLFPNGNISDSDIRLRVRAYFYDNNNVLAGSVSKLVDNVRDAVSLSMSDLYSGENYNVVVLADFVIMSGSSIDIEFWAVENERDYYSIKIVDQGYSGLQYRSVGVAYTSIMGGNISYVDIEGLGALVYILFNNINTSEIKNIHYTWTDVVEYMLVERRVVSSTTYYDDYQTNSNYTGFYDVKYLMPSQDRSCEFSWFLQDGIGNNLSTGNINIPITISDNRLWTVNCTNNEFANDFFNY